MDESSKRSLIALPIVLLIAFGIALAGSYNGQVVNGFPIFALGVIIAFAAQWLAFIPAYLMRTEKFYDLAGTLTYLAVMIVAVLLSSDTDTRSYLLLGMVAIWTIRLGFFLFMRIHHAGEDKRFKEIKQSFWRFLLTWSLQGLWVTFSLAAALAAVTSKDIDPSKGLDIFAYIGLAVWLFGFGVEVIADRQKSKFRAIPENKGKFISTGLWSWSRHPNYFGEIVLWIGVAIVTLPILQGWQWFMLISPVFITLLLTKVSGVPLLEKSADERWGGQEDYEVYKARTSVLVLRPPKST